MSYGQQQQQQHTCAQPSIHNNKINCAHGQNQRFAFNLQKNMFRASSVLLLEKVESICYSLSCGFRLPLAWVCMVSRHSHSGIHSLTQTQATARSKIQTSKTKYATTTKKKNPYNLTMCAVFVCVSVVEWSTHDSFGGIVICLIRIRAHM